MPADEAKTLYVEQVQQMDPSWQPGGEPGASSGSKPPQRGGMGPVFSAFAATEEEKADACKVHTCNWHPAGCRGNSWGQTIKGLRCHGCTGSRGPSLPAASPPTCCS